MSRIPERPRAELSTDQLAVHDSIAGGERAKGPRLFDLSTDDGRLLGPFNALLLQPAVGGAVSALGEAIRFRTAMTPRLRELAILRVAADRRSDYEWYAHEQVARHVGVSDREIAVVKSGEPWMGDDPGERAGLRLVDALVERSPVGEALYEEARSALGEAVIFELTCLVGYYGLLASLMEVYDVGVPAGVDAPFGGPSTSP